MIEKWLDAEGIMLELKLIILKFDSTKHKVIIYPSYLFFFFLYFLVEIMLS